MKLDIIDEVLSENLELYDRAICGIRQCLPSYEKKCSELISEIAKCESINHANNRFDALLDIQVTLSKLLFGRQIDIGKRLEDLTREFDRLDNTQTREYWYRKFREGVIWPTALQIRGQNTN